MEGGGGGGLSFICGKWGNFSGWADLVCVQDSGAEWFWWLAGWITLLFLGFSKCTLHRTKGTHISPTSDPRKHCVGVWFQMATQLHHCAPVNTMKTKLTHRWHSTAPTLPNLDLQHTNVEDQVKSDKWDIKLYLKSCTNRFSGTFSPRALKPQEYLTHNQSLKGF